MSTSHQYFEIIFMTNRCTTCYTHSDDGKIQILF